tara:strand:+ start:262 stop:474 length:213 start_codon:yes stop_codon:yes gene_type:complete
MGRTFRKEKTYGQKKSRLNSHRDLPDYQDEMIDGDEYFDDEEEFLYGKLHSKEQDVVRSEDEPSGQRNQR